MKDFRKLKVWERAHQFVLAVYQTTPSFPRDETYGLTRQIRRAASSIPSNIAEGCGRDGDAESARFCLIARGSASELEYQILLAHDLITQHYDRIASRYDSFVRPESSSDRRLNAKDIEEIPADQNSHPHFPRRLMGPGEAEKH